MRKDEVKANVKGTSRTVDKEFDDIKKFLEAIGGCTETTETAQNIPRRIENKSKRTRGFEKTIEDVSYAAMLVNDWLELSIEPFQGTRAEAIMRLRLAKVVMAAWRDPKRHTAPGGMTGEAAERLRSAPLLSGAEEDILNHPGAFKNGAPGALISALAGTLLDMTAFASGLAAALLETSMQKEKIVTDIKTILGNSKDSAESA